MFLKHVRLCWKNRNQLQNGWESGLKKLPDSLKTWRSAAFFSGSEGGIGQIWGNPLHNWSLFDFQIKRLIGELEDLIKQYFDQPIKIRP